MHKVMFLAITKYQVSEYCMVNISSHELSVISSCPGLCLLFKSISVYMTKGKDVRNHTHYYMRRLLECE